MKKLIGKECGCVFDLPSFDWPVDGCPAWVVVVDVDSPMIELRSKFGGNTFWINMDKIKKIWETNAEIQSDTPSK